MTCDTLARKQLPNRKVVNLVLLLITLDYWQFIFEIFSVTVSTLVEQVRSSPRNSRMRLLSPQTRHRMCNGISLGGALESSQASQ